MRELVVDVAVWSWRHENLLKREEGAFSKDFLHDVAITLHKLRREDIGGWEDAPFSSGSTCIYHDHVAESEPCFKTMF